MSISMTHGSGVQIDLIWWSQIHNDLSMILMKTNFKIAKIMLNCYHNLDNGDHDMMFNVLPIRTTQNCRDIHIYI